MAKVRIPITHDITASAIITTTATIATPDGYAARVNKVDVVTSAAIATVGLTEFFVVVASKATLATAINGLAAATKGAWLYGKNIVDTGPGQAAAKNLSPLPYTELDDWVELEEANIFGSTVYVHTGAPGVKATGPTVLLTVIIDYDFVKTTAAMANAFANQQG